MSFIKKYTTWFLIITLVFALAGCGNSSENTENKEDNRAAESTEITEGTENPDSSNPAAGNEDTAGSEQEGSKADETQTAASDILVVYFSRTGEQYTVGVIDKGNTAIVAEMIAEETGADMFEILPQEDYYPYTYDELTDVAKKEQNENARPAYQGDVPDLSGYSTVFIGAPVWWGDWPMICYTFFEENADALAEKTLIPFSTHEGSGLSGFDRKLASAIPGASVADGLAIRGNDAQNKQDNVRERVKGWLSDLGY